MHITYRPKGVCSQLFEIDVENGIIEKVKADAAAICRAFRGCLWG